MVDRGLASTNIGEGRSLCVCVCARTRVCVCVRVRAWRIRDDRYCIAPDAKTEDFAKKRWRYVRLWVHQKNINGSCQRESRVKGPIRGAACAQQRSGHCEWD